MVHHNNPAKDFRQSQYHVRSSLYRVQVFFLLSKTEGDDAAQGSIQYSFMVIVVAFRGVDRGDERNTNTCTSGIKCLVSSPAILLGKAALTNILVLLILIEHPFLYTRSVPRTSAEAALHSSFTMRSITSHAARHTLFEKHAFVR